MPELPPTHLTVWGRHGMRLTLALFSIAGSVILAGSLASGGERAEAETLRGKVVELTAVLKAEGVPHDAEPVAKQVVLQMADGAVVPLLSDDASRALFADKRLRDRPAELQARRLAGLPYVQVVSFRVEDDGQMRVPEYFCEVCTISVRYPQDCPCCQGPMVLRMKPESR